MLTEHSPKSKIAINISTMVLVPLMLLALLNAPVPIKAVKTLNPTLLDALSILLVALAVVKPLRRISLGMIFAVGVLVIKFFGFLVMFRNEGTPFSVGEIKNFIIANKAFFYLILLTVAAATPKLKNFRLTTTTYVIAWLTLATYVTQRFAFGIPRPTLFMENNFELIGLLVLTIAETTRRRSEDAGLPVTLLLVTTAAVLISASRSAGLAMVLAYMIVLPKGVSIKSLLAILVIGVIAVMAASVFIGRGADISQIDRFRMLTLFFNEVKSYGIIQFLFGHLGLQELHSSTCSALSYYSALFSSAEDGRCYSVIFHALLLRLVFDHGALGVVFIFVTVFYLIRSSGYSMKPSLAIIAVLLSSAISVSSLASGAVSFPLLLVLFAKTEIRFGQRTYTTAEMENSGSSFSQAMAQ